MQNLYSFYKDTNFIMHSGKLGMHWGYRHYQPYSAGYDAQNEGVFLGQLASKVTYGKNWATAFAKSLAGQAKEGAKSRFDAWNKIDTSKTMAEIMRLQKEARSNLTRARHYGDLSGLALERARAERHQNDITSQIFDTLHDIQQTYKARGEQAAKKSGALYEQASLDTKTKRIANSMKKLISLGKTDVRSIPDIISTVRLDATRGKNRETEIERIGSRDVAGMLGKLAGLNKQQTAMPTSALISWMQAASGKGRGTETQRAIDQVIKERQQMGYSGGRDALEKIVKLVYSHTGNEIVTNDVMNMLPKEQRLWE